MFKEILVSACLVGVACNSESRAAVILSDTFNYPDGVLQNVSSNKWIGHSGTTNQVDVTRGALNLTGAESQDVSALLAGQPYATTNGAVLYAGFDLKLTALPSKTGSYFAHFKDSTEGFRGRIWALTNGAAPGAYRVGISSGSSSTAAAVHNADLQPGVSYKIVFSLAVSNAVATLWINPTSNANTQISSEAAAGVPIAAFAFRQATGIGVVTIDNLVIETTFQDVVPPTETAPSPTAPTSTNADVLPIAPASPPPAAAQTVPITGAPPILPVALVITVQPESKTVSTGQDVSFKAQAQGAEPMFYQWQFNQNDIPDATNQVLTISNAGQKQQGDYRLIVKNASGMATSVAARLTVIGPEPPQIFSQPISLTVDQGQTANFFVAASGSALLRYQWRFDGSEILGATSSTLTLTNAQPSQSGNYRVTVSHSGGSVESETARLIVNSPITEVPPSTFKPPVVLFTNYLARLFRPGDRLTNTFTEHALRPGEALTMRVVVTAADERPVTLSADSNELPASARWELRETTGTNLTAVFTFAPTPNEAGSNFVISLYASASTGANATQWSFYVPTEQEQQIVISEFLPNPATLETAPHFNPLRRAEPAPNPAWQDEYVEVVNDSDREMDLSHWTLSDSAQVRHRFAESFVLQSRGAIVVYGGPRTGFPPLLMAPTVWASESATGLGFHDSSSDAVIIRNAQGRMVSRVVYSLVSTNSSLTRYPTLDDEFVPHSGISTDHTSPGVNYDGRKFSELTQLPPAPIILRAIVRRGTRIVLTWNADKGRAYSVFQSANPSGPYWPLATGLRFPDQTARYEVEGEEDHDARFYRISAP